MTALLFQCLSSHTCRHLADWITNKFKKTFEMSFHFLIWGNDTWSRPKIFFCLICGRVSYVFLFVTSAFWIFWVFPYHFNFCEVICSLATPYVVFTISVALLFFLLFNKSSQSWLNFPMMWLQGTNRRSFVVCWLQSLLNSPGVMTG